MATARKRRWSQRVTEGKSSPYRSAMSMLTFYLNRAGKTLPASSRRKVEAAKEELRALYGKPAKRTTTRSRTAVRRRRTTKQRKSAPRSRTRSRRSSRT